MEYRLPDEKCWCDSCQRAVDADDDGIFITCAVCKGEIDESDGMRA